MKRRYGSIAFDIVLSALLVVIAFATLYPFWNVLIVSFSEPSDAIRGNQYFLPRVFSLVSYQAIFEGKQNFVQAAVMSVTRTLTGTLVSVLLTTFLAYLVSKKDFVLKGLIIKVFVTSMYLQAGLIPVYLLYRQLSLINNFLVYIIPGLISAYYLLIMKSYIEDIPVSLKESATIDGAGELVVFLRIIVPLSVPVIATVALYLAVWQWSSWQDTFIFASRNKALTTLQYEMVKIIRQNSIELSQQQIRDKSAMKSVATPQSIQYAIIVLVTVPILLVYPFLQKYFIQGITLGAVKE